MGAAAPFVEQCNIMPGARQRQAYSSAQAAAAAPGAEAGPLSPVPEQQCHWAIDVDATPLLPRDPSARTPSPPTSAQGLVDAESGSPVFAPQGDSFQQDAAGLAATQRQESALPPQQPAWFAEVHLSGPEFRDEHGRVVALRGVNLSGGSKVPTRPDGATHLPDSLAETTGVSFVGRPFALAEAEQHLARLREWGFTLLRFIITWEAIEHGGPGKYDEEYIAYVRQVVQLAGRYNLLIYVDPHQDVWSRWTGGDGAPAWTLECAGFNLYDSALCMTGATVTHQECQGKAEDFPKMLWPTNYFKLACQTMFTLFFGGDRFAPQAMAWGEAGGQPIQQYLQRHFINAVAHLARALGDCPNVVGYGAMNEPSPGYIGQPNLSKLWGPLRNGAMPTAVQAMAAGDGFQQSVGNYQRIGLRTGTVDLNKKGNARAWKDGRWCPWRQEGVWEVQQGKKGKGTPVLVKPEYFAAADFGREHWLPFAQKYARAVRRAAAEGGRPAAAPELFLFAELPPHDLGLCSFPTIPPEDLTSVVNATHWYDNLTLFMGAYYRSMSFDVQRGKPVVGAENVLKMLVRQLADVKAWGKPRDGKFGAAGAPTLIGECGIPFNMHGGDSYRTGDWKRQRDAMDATIKALEANQLHFTLWNYNPHHDPKWGDCWNREDLSIFSGTEGRALEAVVRPYAVAVAGKPLRSEFDRRSGRYVLEYSCQDGAGPPTPDPGKETIIFIPGMQYRHGVTVTCSDGHSVIERCPSGRANRLVRYAHTAGQDTHVVKIQRKEGCPGGEEETEMA